MPIFFVILAIVLFGYLIFQINKDIAAKSRWLDKVYELKLLNKDTDTIITQHTGYYNYDMSKEIIHKLHAFFESMQQDKTIVDFLKDPKNSAMYDDLKSGFDTKERLIHVFTSTNSILNHSTRFLTTIITQMPQCEYTKELVELHSKLMLLGVGSDSNVQEIQLLHQKIQKRVQKEYSYNVELYASHVTILLENFSKLHKLYDENSELDFDKKINQFIKHLKFHIVDQIKAFEIIMSVLVFGIFVLIMGTLWLLNDKIKKELHLKTFRQAVASSDNYILITDATHKIEFINDAFVQNSGFQKDDILGRTPSLFKSGLNSKEFYEDLEMTIARGERWSGEFVTKDSQGNLRFEKATISPILDEYGKITHYVAIKLDITSDRMHQKEIEAKNQEIEARYYTDYLTSLQNRNCLMRKLDRGIAGRLYYININDFTQIKTFYGMKNSDTIIKKLSQVLQDFARTLEYETILFRVKFDEFCLWCEEDLIPALKVMQKLHSFIKNNDFFIDNTLLNIDITIGCSKDSNPKNQNRYIEAEIAHHNARNQNLNYMIYAPNNFIENRYKKNLETIKLIQDAIDSNRVIIYFQPIFDIQTKTVYMYEVLVRIRGISGEILSPEEFLEASKMTNYYHKITRIVVKKTFEMLNKNQDKKFSINVSNIDFTNEITQKVLISELINAKSPQNITLEILESENIQDYILIKDAINKIKKFGCKIAIDDFGSGHSNYYRLSQLDVDYIKIDGSIIKDLDKDTYSLAVIETIMTFAKKMHYPVVAEYVHSKKIYEIIKSYDIEYAQGFYLGKPKEDLELL